MKKYYDLYEEKLCAILDWKAGYGSIEEAKSHFKTSNVREVTLKEFNNIYKKYTNSENDFIDIPEEELKQLSLF